MVFKSRLETTPAAFGTSRLTKPLLYYSERYERLFKVPAGFVTDYASIPRLLQLPFSKLGNHREAAVIHDYLYYAETDYQGVTRKVADQVFYEAMLSKGVPKWKAATFYRAVRVFGRLAGFRKRKKNG